MPNKRSRKIFTTSNKYQTQIILLTFFPPLVICLFFAGFMSIMYKELTAVLLYNSPADLARQVSQWSVLIVGVLCALFIFALMWAFIVSRSLVGAFGRIIREMDEVIDGRSKKLLGARNDDHLANELLKRINVLAKHYIEGKK